jgi:hypothetical protein
LLEKFIRQFATKILIEADPAVFTFRCGDKTLQLPTFVYLFRTDPRDAVVAVGEYVDDPDAIRVDLFGEKASTSEDGLRMEAFEAFLRFALAKLRSRLALTRPYILFRNVRTFRALFHGYQEALFRNAAEAAGAAWVTFEQ